MCGLSTCPILDSIKERTGELEIKIGDVSSLTPPGIFIGTYNYPKVYAGPLAVVDTARDYPTGNEYGKGMEEILSLNRNLYRASKQIRVSDLEGTATRSIQEAAMSSAYVDMEMNISRNLGNRIDRDRTFESPLTSMVELNSIRMSSNAKIPRKVDYFHSDTAFNSSDAVWELYKSGMSIGYLEGIFSSGALGIGKKRRLVPTRWSITAVDDIIYRKMKGEIIQYPVVSEIQVYRNSYNGNRFTIIILPYSLAYEMQELWTENSLWESSGNVSIDYEYSGGRKKYADEVGGAYYAARLAVFEHLNAIRRQAAVIVLRTIGQDYYSPLGVWLVRETVRKAFESSPVSYGSVDELVREERTGIRNWNNNSKVIKQSFIQKNIMEYF